MRLPRGSVLLLLAQRDVAAGRAACTVGTSASRHQRADVREKLFGSTGVPTTLVMTSSPGGNASSSAG